MKHSLKTCLTGIAAAAFLPMALAGGGTGNGQPGGGTLKNPTAGTSIRTGVIGAVGPKKPPSLAAFLCLRNLHRVRAFVERFSASGQTSRNVSRCR